MHVFIRIDYQTASKILNAIQDKIKCHFMRQLISNTNYYWRQFLYNNYRKYCSNGYYPNQCIIERLFHSINIKLDYLNRSLFGLSVRYSCIAI